MAIWTRSPSIRQVMASLRRGTPPATIAARLPGFSAFSLLLSALSLLLLGLFMILSWHLVRHVEGLVVDIRSHRARQKEELQAPTPLRQLLDDDTFARELAIVPHHAARLHLQRARLLATRQDDARAAHHFATAASLDPRSPAAGDLLAWSSILLRCGDRTRAMELVRRIDGSSLSAAEGKELVAVLMDLQMAARRERDDASQPIAP